MYNKCIKAQSQSLFYWKLLCNIKKNYLNYLNYLSHNPYFTGNSFAIGTRINIIKYLLESQSLFYWKLLCNCNYNYVTAPYIKVTILILLETPLQWYCGYCGYCGYCVTILILLETPLQSEAVFDLFNGVVVTILILLETPLQLMKKININ